MTRTKTSISVEKNTISVSGGFRFEASTAWWIKSVSASSCLHFVMGEESTHWDMSDVGVIPDLILYFSLPSFLSGCTL